MEGGGAHASLVEKLKALQMVEQMIASEEQHMLSEFYSCDNVYMPSKLIASGGQHMSTGGQHVSSELVASGGQYMSSEPIASQGVVETTNL